MGHLNALAGVAALGAGYWLHTTFNHPYEWLLLGLAVMAIGLYYPDTKLESIIKMYKWVWKDRIK